MKLAQRIFDLVIVTAAAIAVIGAWAWLAYVPFRGNAMLGIPPDQQPMTLAQLGTYGDMFGALTCLFTGLGFVGAGYAVVLQLRQLRHQQDEMERERLERGRAEELRRAEKALADALDRRMAMLNATNFLAQTYAAKLAALPVEPISHADRKKLEEIRSQRADAEIQLNKCMELLAKMLEQISEEHSRELKNYMDKQAKTK